MKQLTSFLLVMLMIATLLSVLSGSAVSSETTVLVPLGGGTFGEGDGSAGNPYIITDLLDLQAMNFDLRANYSLANDIDASETSTWNSRAGFTPVGNDTLEFKGSLDGCNYTISGLFINRSSQDYVGLFGYLNESAQISNLNLINCNVIGDYYVGGLTGYNLGTIENCTSSSRVNGGMYVGGMIGYHGGFVARSSSSSAVTGTMGSIGGLIGYSNLGHTTECHATGDVQGMGYLGGLAGYLAGGSFTRNYARGDVTGTDDLVGGLVGYQSEQPITDCYATGDVIGDSGVGGLIGGYAGSVTNSFSTGKASGNGNVGGFRGLFTSGTLTGCHWDVNTSETTDGVGDTDPEPAGVAGNTTVEMMQQATFTGWDFGNTWYIIDGLTYPDLQWSRGITLYSGGSGTVDDPYIISNAYDLQNMSLELDAHYVLGNDFDASVTSSWNGGNGFVAVGDGGNPFTGSLEGNGYEINRLYINDPGSGTFGLFGFLNSGASVSNLSLVDANFTANSKLGGIAGVSQNSEIVNCHVSGTIIANGSEVGGIVGFQDGGVTEGCSFSGTVSGTNRVGGLVGYMLNTAELYRSFSNATVTASNTDSRVGGAVGDLAENSFSEECYSSGHVSGIKFVGGFVGRTWHSDATDCYSRSTVNGSSYVGGFVGIHQNDDDDIIQYCYSTGSVSANSNVGGFVGLAAAAPVIADSYWDTEASEMATSPEGGIGKTTAEMKLRSTYTDWDFHNVWYIRQDGSEYPVFIWDIEIKYVITDIYELDLVRFDLDGDYVVANDINASATSGWNSGAGFVPIANDTDPGTGGFQGTAFTGSINGQSYDITDLFINRTGEDYVGLFGYIGAGGSVSNVSLTYVNASGDWYVGGFAGVNRGNITNCYSTGNAGGTDFVGGFVGRNWNGTITNCYSTGNASGTSNVGGFAGYNWNGTITDCYSTGNASGTSNVGGFTGNNSGMVADCFWDNQTSGLTTSAGGTGKSTLEMKTKNTFMAAGWDFVSVWYIRPDGSEYPVFIRDIEIKHLITNLYELDIVRFDLDGDYIVANDIDASTSVSWNAGAGFEPIGNATNPFNGSLKGQGFTISNLTVNRSLEHYSALFGVISPNAVIQNLTMKNSYSNGNWYVSALVGLNHGEIRACHVDNLTFSGNYRLGSVAGVNNGTILDCSAYIYHTGSFSEAGVIAGWNDATGIINNSHGWGFLSGSDEIGGLVGRNYGNVTNSKSSAIASGNSNIGGLIGTNRGTITDCYSTGNSSGTDLVGGFAGNNLGGTITNCYSTGNASGTTNVGGFAGDNTGTIADCFWDNQTSGLTTSAGGTDKNTMEMMDLTTFSNAGWDIAHVRDHLGEMWYIDDGLEYPRLLWETYIDTYPPVADAGSNVYIGQGDTVFFDGSNSTDNVDVENYTWTFDYEGSTVTLYGVNPTFQFFHAETITVTLVVLDLAGIQDVDYMGVHVNDTTLPEADAGDDKDGGMGDVITFDGAGSQDNVAVVNYTWQFVYNAMPVELYGVSPSFTFDLMGEYEVLLTVSDDAGLSNKDTVWVNITDTTPPVSNAGSDQQVSPGTLVTFNGAGSSDNVGIVNYTWTFEYDNGTVNLYDEITQFPFDVEGSYIITLTVTDAQGNFHSDVVLLAVGATFTMELEPGWNLISIPTNETDWSIESVLSSIDGLYSRVQTYDAATDSWLLYERNAPSWLNTLTMLEPQQGYWIDIETEGPVTLSLHSQENDSPVEMELEKGWNLIGYPTMMENQTVEEVFSGISWDMVQMGDQVWDYNLVYLPGWYVMEPGKGYWIHITRDEVLTIEP